VDSSRPDAALREGSGRGGLPPLASPYQNRRAAALVTSWMTWAPRPGSDVVVKTQTENERPGQALDALRVSGRPGPRRGHPGARLGVARGLGHPAASKPTIFGLLGSDMLGLTGP